MKYEDIKVGETYNVRVKVIGVAKNGVDAIYVDDEGIAGLHIGKRRVGILRPISPENGIKNTEPAPKYDPCRLFRKGDKVRVVAYKGRTPKNSPTNDGCVLKEENDCNTVIVNFGEYGRWQINVAYLELITPVKELEPYRVGTGIDSQLLYCNSELFAEFEKEEEAKRVCDLLNAEYRKEMAK